MKKKFLYSFVVILLVSICSSLIATKSKIKFKPILKNELPYSLINAVTLKNVNNVNLKIAIIDSGIDLSDDSFRGINIKSFKINSASDNINKHGTYVSNIVCTSKLLSVQNKEIYKYLEFYAIDMGREDTLNVQSLITALKKAIELKADIINISAGTYKDNLELRNLVKTAINKGIILVCASGNDSTKQYYYPASYEGVISVTSVDSNKEYLLANNFNNKISVSAPGERISTSIIDKKTNQLVKLYGTSASAALITDVIIIIKNVESNLKPYDILKMLKNTSEHLGNKSENEYYGYGMINIKNEIEYLNKPFYYKLLDVF